MSQVGDLLRASIQAHTTAKDRRRDRKRRNARTKSSDAYTLRKQAHDLDPEHSDPAWQDQVQGIQGFRTQDQIHNAMMAFYEDIGVRPKGGR